MFKGEAASLHIIRECVDAVLKQSADTVLNFWSCSVHESSEYLWLCFFTYISLSDTEWAMFQNEQDYEKKY